MIPSHRPANRFQPSQPTRLKTPCSDLSNRNAPLLESSQALENIGSASFLIATETQAGLSNLPSEISNLGSRIWPLALQLPEKEKLGESNRQSCRLESFLSGAESVTWTFLIDKTLRALARRANFGPAHPAQLSGYPSIVSSRNANRSPRIKSLRPSTRQNPCLPERNFLFKQITPAKSIE